MTQPFEEQFRNLKMERDALREENTRLKRQVELLESSNASLLFERRKLKHRSQKRLHRMKEAMLQAAAAKSALMIATSDQVDDV